MQFMTVASMPIWSDLTRSISSPVRPRQMFIGPGEEVYTGMIVGQSSKAVDIDVNVCKTKHLTNTRSSSADEALRLVPPKIMSLEQAIEYVDTDELLEVTPHHLRLRKKILDARLRKRASQKS